MSAGFPSRRTLGLAWAALAGLTLVTALAGRTMAGEATAPLGLGLAALLLLAGGLKARLILLVYLNLRAAAPGWRTLFALWVGLVLLLVLGITYASTLEELINSIS